MRVQKAEMRGGVEALFLGEAAWSEQFGRHLARMVHELALGILDEDAEVQLPGE